MNHPRPGMPALLLQGQQQAVQATAATTSCTPAWWVITPSYHGLHRHGLRDQNPNGRDVGSRRVTPAVPHSCSTLPRCLKCSRVTVGWSQPGHSEPLAGHAGLEGHTLPQPGCWCEGSAPPPELAAPTRASTIPSQWHPRRPARPRAAPGAGRASASAGRRGEDGPGTGCEGRRRRAGREAAG